MKTLVTAALVAATTATAAPAFTPAEVEEVVTCISLTSTYRAVKDSGRSLSWAGLKRLNAEFMTDPAAQSALDGMRDMLRDPAMTDDAMLFLLRGTVNPAGAEVFARCIEEAF